NQGPLVAEAGIRIWVRRNRSRFHADFLFELSAEEFANLKSHFGDGLRISVEGMTVAFDCRSQTNEGCCPEPEGCRVGASAAAAQHLSNETAHGFDSVGSEWQA